MNKQINVKYVMHYISWVLKPVMGQSIIFKTQKMHLYGACFYPWYMHDSNCKTWTVIVMIDYSLQCVFRICMMCLGASCAAPF